MAVMMARLVRLLNNPWLLGSLIAGASIVAILETSYSQDAAKGEAVLPTVAPYEDLTPRDDGNGKWGYVRIADAESTGKGGVEQPTNSPKRWQIAPKFDEASVFQEGAASVRLARLWGFIDETGRFFAQPKYDEVSEFLGGYAAVRVKERWGYINRRGEVVIPPQYEDARVFNEGLAPVSKDGKWGYVNTLGEFVIPPQFDDAQVFAEGVAVVCRGAKMGYVLKDGKPLTSLLFDRAETFRHGRAAVLSGKRWGILDNLGHLVVPFQFEAMSCQYSEGLAAAKSMGKWGFVDLRGGWVIKPIYDRANDFAHGLAVVVQGNKLCVIDPLGNVKQIAAMSAEVGAMGSESHSSKK